MAIKETREYRNFNSYEIREKDDEGYVVEGYAALFDEPYTLWKDEDGHEYKEVIRSDAFTETDVRDIIFLYNHEGMVYARTKNKSLTVTIDEKGIKVRADLSLTNGARELFESIKTGLVDQMSWAFTIKDQSYDKKTRTRSVDAVEKIYDVSAVSIPANPATSISARSFVDGVIEAERAERLEAEQREAVKKRIRIIAEAIKNGN